MIILTNAILIDHFGRVLLSHDPQTNTIVMPSAPLPVGVLPTDTLAQSIRDATGLITLPIRLTGVYANANGLTLAFRTIQRGGAIREEDGRPVAGFFEVIPTPEPILPAHRQQLEDALHHTGGPPIFAPEATTLTGRLTRAWNRTSPPIAEPAWTVRATVIIQGKEGVAWRKQSNEPDYSLPSAAVATGQLPDAVAAQLTSGLAGRDVTPRLTGLYLHADQPMLEFAFAVPADAAAAPPTTAAGAVQLEPGAEPDACRPGHVMQVADARANADDVIIRLLPADATD